MQEVISPKATASQYHSIWNPKYNSLLVSRKLRDFVEHNFKGIDGRGFRIFFWYLNTCSYRDKYGNILLESKMLSQFEGRDEENTQAEKFILRFIEKVLVPIGGVLEYTDHNYEENRCRAVKKFHMGTLHDEFIRLWNSKENWPKDSINSQGLVFASTGKVAKYHAILKHRQQEQAEAMSRACGGLTKELLEYLNGDSLCTQVYSELINRNWEDAHNACMQIKDPVLKEQQLRLLREIKLNPRAYYFPSSWGLTPRVFTHGGIPELKRELRIILCHGWHDADLVSSQLAICASLWKLEKIERFLKETKQTKRKVWDEIRSTLNLSEEQWDKFKPYVKEALYTICYGGGEWMIEEPLIDGIKTLGLQITVARVLNNWIFKELKKGQQRAVKIVEERGGMEDAEGKFCKITKDRKVSSVMAEVAQSYELRILISVIRFAKETGNKYFKVTVWQHDGFSMYIERNHEEVYKKIQTVVQGELEKLKIQTQLECKINDKNKIEISKIEKRRRRKHKKKGRNKKYPPFVSRYCNITERNLMQNEKPSLTIEGLIQLDINGSEDLMGNEIPSSVELCHANSMAHCPPMKHLDDSKGLMTERRVDTADLRLTA